MHELALMESLVDAVTEQVGSEKVLAVRLEVGERTCVSKDALSFCFEICAQGTVLEGARLEVLEAGGETLRLRDVEVI